MEGRVLRRLRVDVSCLEARREKVTLGRGIGSL